LLEVADIILPLAPIAESEGTYFNLDGSELQFGSAGKLSGDCRPGWKILRRLGAELGLDGFDQVDLVGLQKDMRAAIGKSEFAAGEADFSAREADKGFHRVGEVPLYSPDALCRRSTPLQGTVQADSYFLGLNPEDASRLKLEEGDPVRVSQPSSGDAAAEIPVRISDQVPPGAVWLRSGTCGTRALGAAMGSIELEKA
jgi:NADH-quinone oxidoreductase subunit G